MYKYLIIGVALMFVASGSYYLNKGPGGELISNAVSGDVPTDTMTPPTPDSVVGVYVCDTNSGCNNKYILLIKSDQTAEMMPVATQGDVASTAAPQPKPERNSIIVNDTITPSTDTSATNGDATAPNQDVSASGTPDTSSSTADSTMSDANAQQNGGDPGAASQNTDQSLSSLSSLDGLDNGSTSLIDKGEWDLGVQNMLIVTFKARGDTTFDVPQKFVIRSVGASLLSKISYTKDLYKDMVKPVFVKQD